MTTTHSLLKNLTELKKIHMHIESIEDIEVEIKKYKETYMQKRIIVHARPYKREQCRCPICGKVCSGYDTKHEKKSYWRASNLNGVQVYILYRPKRIKCPEHGVRTEKIPWADGNSRFTPGFNNEIAWMVCRTSKTTIAEYYGINWRTVGNCVKAAHNRIEPDTSVRMHGCLERICVDETSYHKGHTYITVVYDMDRNRVVWIHDGHGLEVFRMFCEELTPEDRAAIKIVAGDGAKWIDTCTKEYFPNASRCVDFFHVVGWGNDALDKVRVSTATKAVHEFNKTKDKYIKDAEELAKRIKDAEQELKTMPKRGRPSKRKKELIAFLNEAKKKPDSEPAPAKGRPRKGKLPSEQQAKLDELEKNYKDVKGAKYALCHNPENTTANQYDSIKLIQNSYPDLYRAYQLKEALRLVLHMTDAEQAEKELNKWIVECSECGIKAMVELGEKINRHRENILNSVRYQANSAKSESTNTTIKVLINMGRGFRNVNNLIALVYLKCSDLVIEIHNRPQMSAELKAAKRAAANEAKKKRLESVS